MSSTIAAISTPLEAGGLALIRVSGDKALEIADKIFKPFSEILPSKMAGHTCAYGKIVRGEATLDDVVLTVFKAPKSYTGLDTAEISCHGGVYVAKEILRLVIDMGAEPASPGEFTKLAFLNGKLSLTQAESIMDIISAEGEMSLKSARLMREGALYKRIRSVCDSLVNCLGSLAAWADYPDEDLPGTGEEDVLGVIKNARSDISQILKDYDKGRVLREGIDTAIVGKPNVGKSTLMNALLGYERSIVTGAEGTTRDVIEETVRLGEVKLRLCDTAGIRSTDSEAEQIGVGLAKRRLEDAELVLVVLDGSRELTKTDLELIESAKSKKHIILINKSDLPNIIDEEYINDENILRVSANKGENIEKITERVNELFHLGGASDSGAVFANERQRRLCEKALEYLNGAEEAVLGGMTLDGVTICMEKAADELLTLSGEKATEAVVDDVFARFCVGK